MVIENLSGKWYVTENAVLEKRQGRQWEDVEFQHANMGLVTQWSAGLDLLFLNEPLAVGEYRLRLTMGVFKSPGITEGAIEPEYEFSVIAHRNAPEPLWDVSRLSTSKHNAAEQSAGVTMTLANPVLNRDNTTLEFILTAENSYFYGEDFELDVFLDGSWYRVPMRLFIPDIGYIIDPETSIEDRTRTHNPVIATGALPAGQYRIIKEFLRFDPDVHFEQRAYTAREIALAEFTVTEPLEWRG
jgi:hypothetical protein